MKEVAQLLVIFRGGRFSIQFGVDAMNVLLRNWHLAQERLAGHAKVAVRMVRRNVALVAKKDMDRSHGNCLCSLASKE